MDRLDRLEQVVKNLNETVKELQAEVKALQGEPLREIVGEAWESKEGG